MDANFTIG
jgi:hypothetical protein